MEGKTKKRVWILGYCLAHLSSLALSATPSGYGITEAGNLVFIKTPWGSSVYVGPVGLDAIKNYSFEIPLSDFRSAIASGSSNTGGSPGGPSALGDTSSLINEANRQYNNGDFARSLQFVDEVTRREPSNVRGWIMKGSLMHVTGHKDLAQQAWKKALELDPKNEQIKNILGSMK